MTNHTPGNWYEFIDKVGDVYVLAGDAKPGEHHAYYIGNMEDTCGECHANADLMAAGPDLLEACAAFIEAWEKSLQLEKTDVALRLARAAIAKAKGETDD
jgi:hypothetical protein